MRISLGEGGSFILGREMLTHTPSQEAWSRVLEVSAASSSSPSSLAAARYTPKHDAANQGTECEKLLFLYDSSNKRAPNVGRNNPLFWFDIFLCSTSQIIGMFFFPLYGLFEKIPLFHECKI